MMMLPSSSASSSRYIRSTTGCWTCRLRKKKCDEEKPACHTCRHLCIPCDGYCDQKPIWMRDPAAARAKKEEVRQMIGKHGRRRRVASLARLEKEKGKQRVTPPYDEGAVERPEQPSRANSSFMDPSLMDPSPADPSLMDLGLVDPSPVDLSFAKCPNLAEGSSFAERKSEDVSIFDVEFHPDNKVHSGSLEISPPRDVFQPYVEPSRDYCSPTFASSTFDPWSERLLVGSTARNQKHHMLRKRSGSILKDKENCQSKAATSVRDKGLQRLAAMPIPAPYAVTDVYLTVPIPFSNNREAILIKHYIRNIFHFTYRALSENKLTESHRGVLIPLFCSNPAVMHICMSSSALHMLATGQASKEVLHEIQKYRVSSFKHLHDQVKLQGRANMENVLAAVLAFVSFEIHSSLTHWEPLVQCAIDIMIKLDYLNCPPENLGSFLMSRVIWLDILSSVTLGRAPRLCGKYRRILSKSPQEHGYFHLLEMMGCDDTVMFLISEVQCVEEYKCKSLEQGAAVSLTVENDLTLQLDLKLQETEPIPTSSRVLDTRGPSPNPLPTPPLSSSCSSFSSFSSSSSFSPSPSSTDIDLESDEDFDISRIGSVSPDHPDVAKTITRAFRTAARIHLWSLSLGFFPRLPLFQGLLSELIIMITLVPSGSCGFDRSIVFPLLIGGSMATSEADRDFFLYRCRSTPSPEPLRQRFGNLGCVEKILREVWRRRDLEEATFGVGAGREVHWRNVMTENGWDILLV